MRLIDADALLEALRASREAHADTARDYQLLYRCENIVKARPTIEASQQEREKIIEEFAVKLCHELPKHADEIMMEDFIIYDVLTVDGALDIVIQTAERMKGESHG